MIQALRFVLIRCMSAVPILKDGYDKSKIALHDISYIRRTVIAIPVESIEAPAMLRVRFTGFLLLVTLATLITAAFAIRARTTYHESVRAHGLHAHQARLYVNQLEGSIKDAKRKIETCPTRSEEWATRRDLRLMPLATDPADFPTEGKNLIVVANYLGVLHFRMFDIEGKIVVDHAEGEGTHPRIKVFKKQLATLWPPHELTETEKSRVMTSATSFVEDYRTWLQADVRFLEAARAATVAKAEQYERLARRP